MSALILVSLATSAGCAAYLLPSVARWMTGRGDRIDMLACPVCFVMAITALFNARWLLWPDAIGVMASDEFAAWTGLRVLSIIGSAAVFRSFVLARRV